MMRRMVCVTAVAIGVAFGGASLGGGVAAPDFTGALTGRSLVHEAIVPAPAKDVWEAFTTEEGRAAWLTPINKVDLRVGGTIECHYDGTRTIGQPGNIMLHILAIEPERVLAFRFDAPETAPQLEIGESAWTVVSFEPLSERSTRVRCAMHGLGEGPEWDGAVKHFEWGNAATLAKLREHFGAAKQAERNAEAWEQVRRMIGGEWIHETIAEGGRVFRARSVVEDGCDGVSMFSRGWLGDADGMFFHGVTQFWREPGEDGAVRFQNVNEHGSVARGQIHLQENGALKWEWAQTEQGGTQTRFDIETIFTGEDQYRMVGRRNGSDGTAKPLMDLVFVRVDAAPAEFRKMKEATGG